MTWCKPCMKLSLEHSTRCNSTRIGHNRVALNCLMSTDATSTESEHWSSSVGSGTVGLFKLALTHARARFSTLIFQKMRFWTVKFQRSIILTPKIFSIQVVYIQSYMTLWSNYCMRGRFSRHGSFRGTLFAKQCIQQPMWNILTQEPLTWTPLISSPL